MAEATFSSQIPHPEKKKEEKKALQSTDCNLFTSNVQMYSDFWMYYHINSPTVSMCVSLNIFLKIFFLAVLP